MERHGLAEAMAETQRAHPRLMQTLASMSDAQVQEPSLLPGWSRGHVATHIARNAESHVRMLEGARRGERLEQYVGDATGRAAAIDEGASRSAADLLHDVETSALRLFMLWRDVPDTVWDQQLRAIGGDQTAWKLVFSRWRETEIHNVDLGLGYRPADWPRRFVVVTLPHVASSLDHRVPRDTTIELRATDVDFSERFGRGPTTTSVHAPGHVLLAWVAGRPVDHQEVDVVEGELPELGPWA